MDTQLMYELFLNAAIAIVGATGIIAIAVNSTWKNPRI